MTHLTNATTEIEQDAANLYFLSIPTVAPNSVAIIMSDRWSSPRIIAHPKPPASTDETVITPLSVEATERTQTDGLTHVTRDAPLAVIEHDYADFILLKGVAEKSVAIDYYEDDPRLIVDTTESEDPDIKLPLPARS